jgi:arsenate reductase
MSGPGAGQVVFVCEHGSGKSLIASEWFNRLAGARGLAVRAVCRGLSPEPAPARIAEGLRGDGFDVGLFHASALAPADLAGAARLVMIGTEPPPWAAAETIAVERWDGIPPASLDFVASRDAMLERIPKLLDSLGGEGPTP